MVGAALAPVMPATVMCDGCGLALRPSSMPHHLKNYCSSRVEEVFPRVRGGRKNLRPIPPKAALAPVPKALSREEFVALGPIPDVHVRSQNPLPHAKMNSSSQPAPPGAGLPKAAPRPARARQVRVEVRLVGCYASRAARNQCSKCRLQECIGGCAKCKRCKLCREWGVLLAGGDATAVAKHAECTALPAVAKRAPPVPGPELVREACPEGAPAGSQKCPFRGLWLPFYRKGACPRMPFEVWMQATRQGQVGRHGPEAVGLWTTQCQHCATPFPSNMNKRTHIPGCERRRFEAELPLNMHPVIMPRPYPENH